MSNHETRIMTDNVHLLLGFARNKDGERPECMRHVIKDMNNFERELAIFESKLRILGNTWRIHQTVNARDVEKARKVLIKKLIDYPEKASNIDSEWRTALLQGDCIYGEKKFMLDIDTQEELDIRQLECVLLNTKAEVLNRVKSPKGWHYITKPFDTRGVCKLGYVTLIRDGYFFVKMVEKVACICLEYSGMLNFTTENKPISDCQNCNGTGIPKHTEEVI